MMMISLKPIGLALRSQLHVRILLVLQSHPISIDYLSSTNICGLSCSLEQLFSLQRALSKQSHEEQSFVSWLGNCHFLSFAQCLYKSHTIFCRRLPSPEQQNLTFSFKGVHKIRPSNYFDHRLSNFPNAGIVILGSHRGLV